MGTWFWISLPLLLLPFALSYSWTGQQEKDQKITSFYYFDGVALLAGCLGIAIAIIAFSSGNWGIPPFLLILMLGLFHLGRGFGLPQRLAARRLMKIQAEQQEKTPFEVPEVGLGDVNQAIRMPAGTRYSYNKRNVYLGNASPEQDFLSKVPKRLLTQEELTELLDSCHWRMPLMLLAAERGFSLESMNRIYHRMTAYFREHPGLNPQVPAQTLLNSNALEYLVRRKVSEAAIQKVFEEFPRIASHREQVSQITSGPQFEADDLPLSATMLQLPELADINRQLDGLAQAQKWRESLEIAVEAVEVSIESFGIEHPHTLLRQGQALLNIGDIAGAENACRKAKIYADHALRSVLPGDTEMFLILIESEHTLVQSYLALGDFQQAIDSVQKGLNRIRNLAHEIVPAPERAEELRVQLMYYLERAGRTYQSINKLDTAATLSRAALYQAWDKYGQEHSYPAGLQIQLALIYHQQGHTTLAGEHFEQARQFARPDPPTLLRWASFLIHDKAYAQAHEVLIDIDGDELHAVFEADRLAMLGEIATAESRYPEALSYKAEAVRLSDKILEQYSTQTSHRQFQEVLAAQFRYVYELLDYVHRFRNDDPQAVCLACEAVLCRKFLGQDAYRDLHKKASETPESLASLTELRELRSKIAATRLIKFNALKFNAELTEAFSRNERLEAELSASVGGFKVHQVDLEKLRSKLPEGAALLEWIYMPWLPPFPGSDEKGSSSYFCLIIYRKNPPVIVNVGEAAPIDKLISGFQMTIAGQSRGIKLPGASGNSDKVLEELYRLLFLPIRPHLKGCSRLFIAPDGEICLIPFELLTENGMPLIAQREYQISYLSTGRDLLNMNEGHSARAYTPPVVFADPDYDLGADSIDHRVFNRLVGARKEGRIVGEMLGVEPKMDGAATEESLKALQSPAILHVATHAYFQDERADVIPKGQKLPNAEIRRRGLRGCGLVMAGANAWLDSSRWQGANEGIVNAEDLLELDLSGTQLVVLSACDTAIGEVRIGLGVMGLRHSIAVAGASTLIMSLWKVPDTATLELMRSFYRRLLEGKTCAESLRQAQLELQESHPDPFYWGAFICQGDPGMLSASLLEEITKSGG